MAELTHWFPPTVKPVHPGVYERMFDPGGARCFARWNGSCWLGNSDWLWKASEVVEPCIHQDDMPWRGLKEQA